MMPRLGRRRRRLYWTVAVLVVAAVGGTIAGVALYRANRPQTYRPGEEHREITRNLDRGLPPDAPAPRFEDRTIAAGLGGFRTFAGPRTSQLPEDMGAGAAWGDFDRDGDDDLFLVSAGGALGRPRSELAPSLLYENRGDGTFAVVDGFPETRIRGMGAAWGDVDGDGWLDLVVTGHRALLLFRNERGALRRDTRFIDRDGYWSGAAWSDFDNDGDLDLYVCGYVRYVEDQAKRTVASLQYGRTIPFTLNPASYEPQPNLLLRNDGAGGFEEVAEALGVSNPEGRSLDSVWHDFDEDGWPDLYVANDISDNVLYHNRKGTFEDVSHAAWVADYRGAMGLAVGDWNRDGDDDLFVSHWIAQENALYDSLLRDVREQAQPSGSAGLRFMDVADMRGLGQIALHRVGWGSAFADLDADGWLDLVVVNGSTFEDEERPPGLVPMPAFLFWNGRGEHFHDLAPLEPSLAVPRVSRGLALSDYDGDGDVDLLIVDLDGGVRLLANEMQAGRWIEIRLVAGEGRPFEGSRLVAHVGSQVLRRTVGETTYLSQSSRTVHFGLGDADRVDRLELRWPDGEVETFQDLSAGALWELSRGDPAPRRVPGALAATRSAPTAAGLTATDRQRLVTFWEKQRAGMRALKVDADCPRAIGLLREALALDPEHEDSRYYLGNCLAETGDTDGALRQFEEIGRRNRQSHRAFKRWGTLRAATATTPEELQSAAEALERAVEINPEATGALQALAEVNLLQGRTGLAEQRLEWVTRSNPQAGGAWFCLAYLAWKQGDATRAGALLERASGSRAEDWKPEGAAAEGDVRQRMHQEASPLVRFFEKWDGSSDPDAAFGNLDAFLGTFS